MTRTKQWKIALIALCAVLVLSLAAVGISAIIPSEARAEQFTVKAVTKGNGTVQIDEGEPSANTVDAFVEKPVENGTAVKFKASPVDDYVFAYWYETDENTPVSFNAEYTVDISAEKTLNAKFFQNSSEITVTKNGNWTTFENGKYTVKDGFDAEYSQTSADRLYVIYEFVGEKWLNWDYDVNVVSEATSNLASIKITIDEETYFSLSFVSRQNTGTDSILIKAPNNIYHRVVLTYILPDYSYNAKPTSVDATFNFSEKQSDSLPKTTARINWDSRLGDVYYLEGINYIQSISTKYILSHAKKMEPVDDSNEVTMQVPQDVSIGFFAFKQDQVVSTIDPLQNTTVEMGGMHYGPDNRYGSNGNTTVYFHDNKVGSPGYYYDTPLTITFKEVAVLPVIHYTKTVDNVVGEKTELHNNENFQLNYEQANNILFEIEQTGLEQNDKFAMTVNGVSTPLIYDAGKCGFTLNDINENKTIVITPDYGEKYVSTPFSFKINILLAKGLDAIVLDSSAPVTVTNDDTYPWYFDPARNSGGYAFTSGISYLESVTAPLFSQLKFTVKGNGSLTFEYHIDGYSMKVMDDTNHNSWAAYNIGSKVYAEKCATGTSTGDWRAYATADGGFKSEIATNLGCGQSYMDYKNVITYNTPRIYNGEQIPDKEETKDSEKYWYKVTVSIQNKQDDEETDIYVAHAIGLTSKPQCANMTVRNVAFYQGNADVHWSVNNIQGEEGDASNQINVNGASQQGEVTAGTTLEFTAVPAEDFTFYGWKDGSGKIISYNTTYKVTVGGDALDIRGVFDKSCTAVARIGETFYKDLSSAISAAQAGEDKNIIIVDNITIENSIEIPSGINLIIPFDRNGNFYQKGNVQQPNISWTEEAKYKLWTVTVTPAATITVYGKLYVGGVLHSIDQSAQGHTSGAYSQLVLNGNVSVKNGGVMDVYGRVTGDGGIDVESGGVLYQPFLILDYAGGNNTYDLFYLNQTPFKRYAMINIQCEKGYTIHYGAELWGHASLYFLSSITTLDTQFISYTGSANGKAGTTTLINLKGTDSYAHGVYDDTHKRPASTANAESVGQTTLTIHGDAEANFMNFLDLVQTDKVAFSIPYNYNIVLESGTFDMNYAFKLMPGAKLTVAEGATLNINKEFYVYDGLVQSTMSGKGYPTAEALKNADYNTNATFVVDGTLNINAGATFLGVVQSTIANATITTAADAVLTGTIIDGGLTSYDCNYSEYESSARAWDTAHGEKGVIATLLPGRTYKSATCANWELPQTTLMYDSGNSETDYHSNTKVNHKAHDDGNPKYIEGKTDAVTGMQGSWAAEHSQHVIDWNYQDGDVLPTEENKHVTLKRYCSELGCTYNESRELLYAPQDWGQITYTGSQFTDDQVKAAINSLFGEDYDLFQAAGATLSYTPFTVVNDDGYDVTITLKNGYWVNGSYSTSDVTLTKRIKVSPAELTASDVDEIQAVTYSGEAYRPQVTLKFNGEPLTLDSDYNVSYSSNTNAGEATIHISVVNKNFSGDFDVHFTINPRDISDAQITDLADCTYSGKAQKLTPTVTVADKRLTAEDFTTAYNSDSDGEACIAVGTVTVTVNGQGNYSGSKTATYKITPKDVSKIAKLDIKEYTYNGKVQELELTVTVDGFEQPLQKGVDYQATCDEILNATDYTVTVQFQGNFTGSATGKLVVSRKNLADADVVIEGLAQSYEYTGSAITPSITVKFEGITLKLYADGSGDYVVTYGANINVASGGTVKIVAGEDENSNFTGEKEVKFTITPKDASLADVKENGTHVYNAQTQSAVVTVTLAGFTITEGDYTISYGDSDRVNAGTVNFTVQFTGNYSGSATSSFEIGRAAVKVTPKAAETPEGKEVADLNYEITGEMYGDDKSTLEGGITLKLDGEVADKHAGDTLTISVEISAEVLAKLSNYNIDNSATAVYTISESVFKDVTVTDVTAPYDGKQHPVVVSGQPLGAATSVKYTLNDEPIQGEPTDVGNYSATIQITLEGYREYSITRSVKITAKQLTVELQKQTVVYSGTAQHPNNDSSYWTVNGAVEGESVTLTLSASLTDVGKTDIVATLVAGDNTKLTNYSCDQASLTLKNGFEVTAKNIAELEFSGVESSYEYSGKAIRPEPTVKYGSITLGKEDYSVVYGNNTTVAEGGTVSVSGTGNYTGSKELTFGITAKNADSAQITVTGTYTYTGKEHNVSVEITFAGYTVTSDDYTISYVTSDRTNVGTVRFEVQFKNNFAGTQDNLSFEITPKNASLTVNEVKFTFDRKEHTAANATYAFVDLVDGDESEIVVTFEGSGTEVGKYDVTAKFTGAKAANYTISVDGDEKLVIEAAKIDGVEVTSEHVYNGKDQTPTLTVKAGDLVLNSDEYNIGYVGNRKNAGNVTVNVEAASKNFTGSKSTEFTIQKAPVSVTVNDQQSVYGDSFVTEFTFVAEGVLDEEQNMVIIKDYLEFSCNASTAKNVDDYEIKATVTSQPSNYQITVVKQGTYKVTPKAVTVKIADQNSVFGYNKAYALDNTLWTVEGELANGEGKDVLQVTLSIPTITKAGTYAITGSYQNNNYTVTFEGSYEGTKGTFTVAKKTVEDNVDDTTFQALVNGEQWQADENYKLADGSLTFSCLVYVYEGEEPKQLKVTYTCNDQNKVSELSLTEEGVYEITVEIDDDNYQGSATYSLEIVGADGRTQHLKEVLNALEKRAGELTPETLTTTNECFETLNFIKQQVDSLSEDEQAMAEEDLAPYLELVEAWNNAVDEDVIATAQAIAQAPINGLMVIASLNAIVMAVYVIGKGGLLR